MQITAGINNNQVLQRDKNNLCRTIIKGITQTAGSLSVKVIKNGKSIKGFNFKKLAGLKKGPFILQLSGIPIGGPYQVIFKFISASRTDTVIKFNNILVGDVWLLAGQSNMQGCGSIKDAEKPHPLVRAFYMNDRWAVAKDPIHNLYEAIDPVHAILNGGTNPAREKLKGTGPGVTFAKEMHRLTGAGQGLICCAHGGTSMSQWDCALKKWGNKSLYGALLRRFEVNGSNVAGLLWYQGCSETHPSKNVTLYTQRMKKLIIDFRKDLKLPNLPVVMVQISKNAQCSQNPAGWNSIQNQQRLLPKVIKNLSVVPSIDLAMEDWIHLSGKAQRRLGKRLADAMYFRKDKKQIELKSVRKKIDPCQNTINIEAEFSNVAGALQAAGRPWGFAISGSEGSFCNTIVDIKLNGSKILICTSLEAAKPRKISLHYGFGTMPYCNITDSNDRSLPVFGPVGIK